VTGFHQHASVLACDRLPLDLIARTVGTPCYVYSARLIRDRFAALSAAFAGVPHALHYALKANSTLALVRLLRHAGAQADANSVGEIDVALRAGFIPEQIVFTGVGKTPDELTRAVALGLKCINAESRGEMERIDAIARAQGTRARVALRVNPDIEANTHAHISTGAKHNKFGVAIDEAAPLCREMAGRPGLEVVGIHAHIGSQITTLEPLRRAARALSGLAGALASQGVRLEHLDVGGGLGIAYDGGEVPSPDAYARAIIDATRDAGLALIVEPGRTVVGPAGALLATIVDVKVHPGGRRFAVLDAGMTELVRPALYGAFHRIVPVVRDGRPDVTCDIVGPVCESSDTFGVDRVLPDPRPGDLVAVLDAGAYGAVMSSNYNRRPQPAEVLVEEGTWRVVKRRQTVEDLLACEE
jgi:diaminopimelate decarboxylase